MNLVPAPDNSDVQHAEIQVTLSWADAERLRITVPWVLRALADRPEAPARMRERRRKAHTALESLLTALSAARRTDAGGAIQAQLRPAEQSHESQ
jgi:hypothetical protein